MENLGLKKRIPTRRMSGVFHSGWMTMHWPGASAVAGGQPAEKAQTHNDSAIPAKLMLAMSSNDFIEFI